MKNIIVLFCLFFCLPIVNAADYYNDDSPASGWITMEHFVLEEAKAEHNTGWPEKEDKWKIWYHFTEDVTNIQWDWRALDGTNDMDTREYTDKWDSRNKGERHSKEHDNFPTDVDNMRIIVTYTYAGNTYIENIIIYDTDDGSDEELQINWQSDTMDMDAVNNMTPIEYRDTDDKTGFLTTFGDTVTNPIDSVLKMVKAPYNFMKWVTNDTTIISFVVGFFMLYGSIIMLLKFNSAGAEVGALIIFLIGFSIVFGTIMEGIGAIGFD